MILRNAGHVVGNLDYSRRLSLTQEIDNILTFSSIEPAGNGQPNFSLLSETHAAKKAT